MSRPCPHCNTHELEPTQLANHSREVLHCPACNGLWLDTKALEALLAQPEVIIAIPRGARLDGRLCPCCQKEMRTFAYPGTFVMIDMCKECQGVWLDRNEFFEIDTVRAYLSKSMRSKHRNEHPSENTTVKARLLQFIDESLAELTC